MPAASTSSKRMKAARTIEILVIPPAVAYIGWLALWLATELIYLLGHNYGTSRALAVINLQLYACTSGLLAGIAGVIVQAKKDTPSRWRFYGCFLLAAPIGSGLVFLFEASRPRFEPMFDMPVRADFDTVPFWIAAVCLWLPFLLLLRRRVPPKLPAEMLAPKTKAKEFWSADV